LEPGGDAAQLAQGTLCRLRQVIRLSEWCFPYRRGLTLLLDGVRRKFNSSRGVHSCGARRASERL
jgi:hypothetical protein